MVTVLINLMDNSYDDHVGHYRQTLQDMKRYLDDSNSPIQSYDEYICLLKINVNRFDYLNKALSKIVVPKNDVVYLRFIGHCGQINGISEIEDFHFNKLIPTLFRIFSDHKLVLNMLGSCNSYYAIPDTQNYNNFVLLYTRSTITDQYSPDNLLLRNYISNDGQIDFQRFILDMGHVNDYLLLEA